VANHRAYLVPTQRELLRDIADYADGGGGKGYTTTDAYRFFHANEQLRTYQRSARTVRRKPTERPSRANYERIAAVRWLRALLDEMCAMGYLDRSQDKRQKTELQRTEEGKVCGIKVGKWAGQPKQIFYSITTKGYQELRRIGL
jgi:hypothetical protein